MKRGETVVEVEAIRAMMHDTVPFYRVLGIQAESVEPEQVVLSLAQTPERLNHVGTMHATAQFGLGEAAGGIMASAAFNDLIAQGAAPLVTQVTISYLKSARGDLRAVASLSREEQERIRSDMNANGRAIFSVPVQVFDAAGVQTTALTTEWILLGPRK